MPLDVEKFKYVYDKWVTESLSDFQAGRMKEIVKKYPFVISDDVPWTPYSGEVSEKTISLITSGGIYLKESQQPFDTKSIHGDPTFRAIPKSVRQQDLGIAHDHYDHRLAEEDINTIFPIQRFIELEKEKVVGKVADFHYSLTYVNDVVTLITKTVPEIIHRIKAAGVNLLFLVPV